MDFSSDSPIKKLQDTLPQEGKVIWIGLRPERKTDLIAVPQAEAIASYRLKGDHFSGRKGSKRQVTLIQQEHINAVASYLQKENLDPGLFRRNIVVKGINLLALKNKIFRIGEVILKYSGECKPCFRMEENLGAGGYNAMQGHGGITARIISGGTIRTGDIVNINVATQE